MVRAFTHGAMGRRIDPSWGGPIELFLVPASVEWNYFYLTTHSNTLLFMVIWHQIHRCGIFFI